jgi:cob(I)alamin adenosyltransferase
MLASIATRTGDDGTTGLLYGQRVPKNHPQIEAVGSLDELNAAVGFAKATTANADHRAELQRIQKDLISLMGEVACAEEDRDHYEDSKFARVGDSELSRIDHAVAAIEAQNIRFDGWATPGANLPAATLDLARTTARRAERRLVGLHECGRHLRPVSLKFVNRVADLLWLMARQSEQ